MTLSPSQVFKLYRTIFQRECLSLTKSKEYARFVLSDNEKRFIKRNHEKIAEYAARYYINNYGINLDNEGIVQEAIDESIRVALQNLM